jgi:hypothetical protein
MQPHEFLDDGESQAETAVRLSGQVVLLTKSLEQLRLKGRIDADAIVGHEDLDVVRAARDAQLDIPVLGRELRRVRQQRVDDLPQAFGVPGYDAP